MPNAHVFLLAGFEKLLVTVVQHWPATQTGVIDLRRDVQGIPILVLPPLPPLLLLVFGQLRSNDMVEVGIRLGAAQNRGLRGRVCVFDLFKDLVKSFGGI